MLEPAVLSPLLAQANHCKAEAQRCSHLLLLSKPAVSCWFENKYPIASFELKKPLLPQNTAKFNLGQA